MTGESQSASEKVSAWFESHPDEAADLELRFHDAGTGVNHITLPSGVRVHRDILHDEYGRDVAIAAGAFSSDRRRTDQIFKMPDVNAHEPGSYWAGESK